MGSPGAQFKEAGSKQGYWGAAPAQPYAVGNGTQKDAPGWEQHQGPGSAQGPGASEKWQGLKQLPRKARISSQKPQGSPESCTPCTVYLYKDMFCQGKQNTAVLQLPQLLSYVNAPGCPLLLPTQPDPCAHMCMHTCCLCTWTPHVHTHAHAHPACAYAHIPAHMHVIEGGCLGSHNILSKTQKLIRIPSHLFH